MDVVRNSADINDACDVAADVPIRGYRSSLARFFKEVGAMHLSSNHHFRFHADRFGVVSARNHPTNRWEDFSIAKRGVKPESLPRDVLDTPPVLPPKQLSKKRHQQLRTVRDKFFTGVEHLKDEFYRAPPASELAQCVAEDPSDPDVSYSNNNDPRG